MDNNKIQNHQLSAKKYIEEHELEKIVSEMLNSVVYDKSKQPIIFMIKYLAGLLSEEERKNYNLIIPDPFPKGKPIVQYPILDKTCESSLKKFLNMTIWNKIKYNKTKFGGTIMNVIKPSETDSDGVVLTDSDCLEVFSSLLIPIINDIHQINEPTNFNFSKTNINKSFDKIQNIFKFSMEYSRNFQNIPLVALMTKENRNFVENQLKSIIEESKLLSGKYLQFLNDENEIKEIFNQNYLNFSQTDEYLIKSDLKRCWPENRAVFYSEKKDLIILINLIDHLKIISINPDYATCYSNLNNIVQTFEKSLKFETNKNYGYITTCPSNLGTTLQIKATIKIENIMNFNIINELTQKLGFDSSQFDKNVLIVSQKNKLKNNEEEFINDFFEKINLIDFHENNILNLAKKLEFNENVNKNITNCYNNVFDLYKLIITPDKHFFNSIFDLPIKLPNNSLDLILISKQFYSVYKRFFDNYYSNVYKFDSGKQQTFNVSFADYILEIKDKSKLLKTNFKVFRNLDSLSFNTQNSINTNSEHLKRLLNENFKGSYVKIKNNEILNELSVQLFGSDEMYKSGILNEECIDYCGIYSLEEKPVIIIINDLDHLQFETNIVNYDQIISNLVDLFKVVKKLEENGTKYSVSPHFGYLSQCPKFTGTGFNIYSTLKLTNLGSNIDKLEELRARLEFGFKIINSDTDKLIEIQLLNHIGMTEKEIFEKWNKVVNELIENDAKSN